MLIMSADENLQCAKSIFYLGITSNIFDVKGLNNKIIVFNANNNREHFALYI